MTITLLAKVCPICDGLLRTEWLPDDNSDRKIAALVKAQEWGRLGFKVIETDLPGAAAVAWCSCVQPKDDGQLPLKLRFED